MGGQGCVYADGLNTGEPVAIFYIAEGPFPALRKGKDPSGVPWLDNYDVFTFIDDSKALTEADTQVCLAHTHE